MSEDTTTQAVVDETKVPAPQGTEATSARTDDDLDTLLAQFDESKPAPSATATPATAAPAADTVKDASAEVLAARDEIRQDRFKRDMNTAVEVVRGEMPADLYDGPFMTAWINAKADADPRLAQAWVQRNENPAKFKQVLGALSKEFAKKYSRLPDPQATEDRAAVTAAVRGSSTRVPEGKAPNYAAMTNNELAAEWDKYGV